MRDALERVFALLSERSLLEETYRFVSVPSPTGDARAGLASTAFWPQQAPGARARADLSIDRLEVGSAP